MGIWVVFRDCFALRGCDTTSLALFDPSICEAALGTSPLPGDS